MRFIKTPPRVAELIFLAVLLWLFATGQGWSVLLADGDTGWHIRNGEQILDTHRVPRSDSFSFASAGHPWFSWEWLADVLFAALFRMAGLKAVAVFCGVAIAASVSILFRHMCWRSAGPLLAFPLAILAVGASSIHYLARPHAIGLLLFAVLGWMIDRARQSPFRAAWCLPLLFALWANLHGSFLGGLAMLGLWAAESLLPGRGTRRASFRPFMIFALSGAATFCNPYGWRLHTHVVEYLGSSWIREAVEEFQSPRFRSESMFQYEVLLFAGLAAVPWLIRRRELYPCGVILLWAHASLGSVRHVPLYCLAAGPFTAAWIQELMDQLGPQPRSGGLRRGRPDSFAGALASLDAAWRPWCCGVTCWPAVLAIVITVTPFHPAPVEFPANKFPRQLLDRNLAQFSGGSGPPRRIFSSDQWSDYLIFRFYPAVRVYFDGRSDFFGPWRGKAYQQLMAGRIDSPAILAREQVDLALVPQDWVLAGILRRDPAWRVADADERAVLFVRNLLASPASPLMKIGSAADSGAE